MAHLIKDCDSNKRKRDGVKAKNKNSCGLVVARSSIQKFACTTCRKSMLNCDRWIFDSSASAHMSSKREWLEEYEKLVTPINLIIGDGRCIKAIGKGCNKVEVFNGEDWCENIMKEVLHVPELGDYNLFSVGQVIKKGYRVR